MYDWSQHKIGIVLSGGGAKGAYEIGCWKAMSEMGLKFTAIAGTSIGGINGFLMSLGKLEAAEEIWIDMGRKSPLRLSLIRLLLVFAERLGILLLLTIEVVVLVPPVGLLAFGEVGVATGLAYLFLRPLISPLQVFILPLFALAVVGTAKFTQQTKIFRLTRSDIRFSLRDARRLARQMTPVEALAVFGLVFMVGLPTGILLYQILMSGHSWAWMAALIPVLALEVVGIILISDAGFSSPGQVSVFSTERLEEILVDHIQSEDTLPAQPHLYVARMREEVVQLPNSTPDWMDEVIRSIVPHKPWKQWTLQDLESYRKKLDDLGLGHYFAHSTETVLGLEYGQLAGKPILEVADSVLSTGAIADFMGRVEDRAHGLDATDHIIRGMRAQFYDPGLVDNTPIVPLLEDEECTVIIVVFLEHGIKDPVDYLETRLNEINSRLRRLNPDLDDSTYNILKDMKFLTPVRRAPSRLRTVQILPIVPSKLLGRGAIGFLRETLWFREERVKELLELGFDDAKKAIELFVNQQVIPLTGDNP